MANAAYNKAKAELLKGTLDFDAPDDIRVMLLETGGFDADHATIAAVLAGAAAELTSTGYSRQALTGEGVTKDDVNDRGEFDAADATFSSVSQDGAETVVAAIVFKFITNDAASIPIAYIDTGGFPISPNGSDIVITWNAEGILQLT